MLAGCYCAPVTRALPFFVLKLTFKTKTQLGCKATVFFRKTFENFFFYAFSVRATHAEYDFLKKIAILFGATNAKSRSENLRCCVYLPRYSRAL